MKIVDAVETARHHASELRKFQRQVALGTNGRTMATVRAVERHERSLAEVLKLLTDVPNIGRRLVGLLVEESQLHMRVWENAQNTVERPDLEARLSSIGREVRHVVRQNGYVLLAAS